MKLSRLVPAATLAFSTIAHAATPPADRWITSWMASPQPAWGAEFILPMGVPAHVNNASIRELRHERFQRTRRLGDL